VTTAPFSEPKEWEECMICDERNHWSRLRHAERELEEATAEARGRKVNELFAALGSQRRQRTSA
jgi:hypothetical protein